MVFICNWSCKGLCIVKMEFGGLFSQPKDGLKTPNPKALFSVKGVVIKNTFSFLKASSCQQEESCDYIAGSMDS